MFQIKTSQTGEFSLTQRKVNILFHSGLQLFGQGPRTLCRAICFTHLTDWNVNVTPKHLHRNTQNYFCPNIWALRCLVKFIHKINHHNYSDWFMNIETALHSQGKLYLIWIPLSNIFVEDFVIGSWGIFSFCNFLFLYCVFVCFWYQHNVGLVKWVGKYSFIVYFLE